jgi:hypothetical protein
MQQFASADRALRIVTDRYGTSDRSSALMKDLRRYADRSVHWVRVDAERTATALASTCGRLFCSVEARRTACANAAQALLRESPLTTADDDTVCAVGPCRRLAPTPLDGSLDYAQLGELLGRMRRSGRNAALANTGGFLLGESWCVIALVVGAEDDGDDRWIEAAVRVSLGNGDDALLTKRNVLVLSTKTSATSPAHADAAGGQAVTTPVAGITPEVFTWLALRDRMSALPEDVQQLLRLHESARQQHSVSVSSFVIGDLDAALSAPLEYAVALWEDYTPRCVLRPSVSAATLYRAAFDTASVESASSGELRRDWAWALTWTVVADATIDIVPALAAASSAAPVCRGISSASTDALEAALNRRVEQPEGPDASRLLRAAVEMKAAMCNVDISEGSADRIDPPAPPTAVIPSSLSAATAMLAFLQLRFGVDACIALEPIEYTDTSRMLVAVDDAQPAREGAALLSPVAAIFDHIQRALMHLRDEYTADAARAEVAVSPESVARIFSPPLQLVAGTVGTGSPPTSASSAQATLSMILTLLNAASTRHRGHAAHRHVHGPIATAAELLLWRPVFDLAPTPTEDGDNRRDDSDVERAASQWRDLGLRFADAAARLVAAKACALLATDSAKHRQEATALLALRDWLYQHQDARMADLHGKVMTVLQQAPRGYGQRILDDFDAIRNALADDRVERFEIVTTNAPGSSRYHPELKIACALGFQPGASAPVQLHLTRRSCAGCTTVLLHDVPRAMGCDPCDLPYRMAAGTLPPASR